MGLAIFSFGFWTSSFTRDEHTAELFPIARFSNRNFNVLTQCRKDSHEPLVGKLSSVPAHQARDLRLGQSHQLPGFLLAHLLTRE